MLSRLLPHTLTLWCREEGKEGVFTRHLLRPVRISVQEKRGKEMDYEQVTARILVDDLDAPLPAVQRGDLFLPGEIEGVSPPDEPMPLCVVRCHVGWGVDRVKTLTLVGEGRGRWRE